MSVLFYFGIGFTVAIITFRMDMKKYPDKAYEATRKEHFLIDMFLISLMWPIIGSAYLLGSLSDWLFSASKPR
jgi:hypothetical protein